MLATAVPGFRVFCSWRVSRCRDVVMLVETAARFKLQAQTRVIMDNYEALSRARFFSK